MKNKNILRIIILFLCLIVLAGLVFWGIEERRKKEEWAQQGILAIDYRRQNGALPRVAGRPVNEEYYVGYDAIDETELYVRLTAYNDYINSNEEELEKLTLKDVEDYLSSEYNEDGSLRIQSGYENIRAYVEWYYAKDGETAVEDYWTELDNIAIEYRDQNSEFPREPIKEMNVDQLQELIKKKNAPSYEINVEVMCGSN